MANQGHGHPLKVIKMLINPFSRMSSFEKHNGPGIIQTNVSCFGGWSGGIRPDNHFACGLRGAVPSRKFRKNTPTGLGVIGRAVSVIERDPKQRADVLAHLGKG